MAVASMKDADDLADYGLSIEQVRAAVDSHVDVDHSVSAL
ncbi:hypothetical protein HX92_3005 [Mycobacterium tuberculosis]|nr:hypothetical protein J112_10365 [Mycobacterium tuberculosis str. Beijing/NITR203]AKO24992.1 hypothetical protein GS11_2066 [Mycobacterium tuberculosis variant bovis BCG]AOZ43144.1 hypothetical protein BTB1458_2145 [Mycobacterium tuberculosis]EQM16747.1 hypothetical protein GuangZ0019_3968 [Mycobacterium tuberculosis GuangZ0019]EQM18998.1 hypothetical protein FJ05194_3052 [Mycobacterium tuberculosis FJ05194]KAF3408790.1 hypothetical protein BIT18_3617 [Mycobacterium tuberculosis variant bovi